MRLVIDDRSWLANPNQLPLYPEQIEKILDVVDDAIEKEIECTYSSNLFLMNILDQITFYDLYDEDSPIIITRELRERMASIFGHLTSWDETENLLPSVYDVVVGEGSCSCYAPSIAWAHKQSMSSPENPVLCISAENIQATGHLSVAVEGNRRYIWFINKYDDTKLYFRWSIFENQKDRDYLETVSVHAFPEIEFIDKCFDGLKDMSKGYRDIISDVVHHLSMLSDHGRDIFSGSWQDVPQRFGSLKVELSDENGKTKNNTKAKKSRTRTMGNDTIILWWHTKISPHQDRIHFCPDRISSGGKIIVGIFCRHLPT